MELMTDSEDHLGTMCSADNILVLDKDKDFIEAEQDQGHGFIELTERFSNNVKLNPVKLQLKIKEVKFTGNIITETSMKADSGKIAAIASQV